MLTTSDRRTGDRRRRSRLAVTRLRAERRGTERRDAPRIRRKVRVYDGADIPAVEVVASWSLEGVTWRMPQTPRTEIVRLELRFPNAEEATSVQARILRVRALEGGVEVDARFESPAVRFELDLARLVESYIRRPFRTGAASL